MQIPISMTPLAARWRVHLRARLLRLRGRGLLLKRSELVRHVAGQDLRIDGGHGLLRQALPDLVHAEQRNAEIAAHGERLPVGGERHLGAVDLAVPRSEDRAVLVFEPALLHAADERDAEPGLALAGVSAAVADRVRRVARPRIGLGDGALEGAVAVIGEQDPAQRLAVAAPPPAP